MAKAALARMMRYQLDEKRKELNIQETQHAQLLSALDGIEQELRAEVGSKTQDVFGMATFSGYLAKTREKQALLKQGVVQAEQKIAAIQEEIITLFAEAKKYEVMVENEHIAMQKNQQHKNTVELDETAMTQFLKKKTDA